MEVRSMACPGVVPAGRAGALHALHCGSAFPWHIPTGLTCQPLRTRGPAPKNTVAHGRTFGASSSEGGSRRTASGLFRSSSAA